MGRTCSEPNEIKKNTHLKYFTALFREQAATTMNEEVISEFMPEVDKVIKHEQRARQFYTKQRRVRAKVKSLKNLKMLTAFEADANKGISTDDLEDLSIPDLLSRFTTVSDLDHSTFLKTFKRHAQGEPSGSASEAVMRHASVAAALQDVVQTNTAAKGTQLSATEITYIMEMFEMEEREFLTLNEFSVMATMAKKLVKVRGASRSIPPPWRSIRFRLAPRTYALRGVRVVSQTKSSKIPTRNIYYRSFSCCKARTGMSQGLKASGLIKGDPYAATDMGSLKSRMKALWILNNPNSYGQIALSSYAHEKER